MNYTIPHQNLQEFQRLYNNLPDYPLCTDILGVCRKAPKHIAIRRRYIQFNKKNYTWQFIQHDLDYEGAGIACIELELPTPTFIVISRENGHAHITHELRTAVYLGKNASKAAKGYIWVIHTAYTKALKADSTFGGLLSKNPFSQHWIVNSCDVNYDLDELAEPLRDVSYQELAKIPAEDWDERFKEYLIPLYGKKVKKKGNRYITEEEDPDGSLFVYHNTRWYAYTITADCKTYDELYAMIEARIIQIIVEFSLELTPGKINSNAKSITKFCWEHRADFIAKRQAFCERQRHLASLSHRARSRNNTNRIRKAKKKLVKEGIPATKTAIAETSGVSRRSVSRRVGELKGTEAMSIGAYSSHEVRKAATEEKIKQVFATFLREGRKVTKTAIAKEAGITRRTLDKYQYLLS